MIQPKEKKSLPPNFGPDQVSDSTSPRWTEVVDHLKGIVIASNVPKGQVSLKKRKEKMEEKKSWKNEGKRRTRPVSSTSPPCSISPNRGEKENSFPSR